MRYDKPCGVENTDEETNRIRIGVVLNLPHIGANVAHIDRVDVLCANKTELNLLLTLGAKVEVLLEFAGSATGYADHGKNAPPEDVHEESLLAMTKPNVHVHAITSEVLQDLAERDQR